MSEIQDLRIMSTTNQIAQNIISELEKLVPEAMKVPEDAAHGGTTRDQ